MLLDVNFWWAIYYFVAGIFIIADLFLLIIFIYALKEGWKFRPKLEIEEGPKDSTFTVRSAMLRDQWKAIQEKFALGTPEALRVAMIEADAFVDEALKKSGLPGQHMADRLSGLNPNELKTLDRVWSAHRLRNDIVHTPGFVVSAKDAETAMGDYEAFLKEIEVLE